MFERDYFTMIASILTNFFVCFRIAKISHTGLIEVGKRADLLLFDRELNLLNTLVFGQVLFQKT